MIFFDIDTQYDFMDPKGALYVPDAESITVNIERLLRAAGERRITTISSQCAHQPNDPEFAIFPPHCIEGERGAQRVFSNLPDLPRREIPVDAEPDPQARIVPGNHYLVKKKVFDLFSNAWLDGLRKKEIFKDQECAVFGVATDYCVRACGLGLANSGARVFLVEDAVRGVEKEKTLLTLEEMRALKVELTTTEQVIERISNLGFE